MNINYKDDLVEIKSNKKNIFTKIILYMRK